MRVLLDADVSIEGVGQRLVASGHDVAALDQEPLLEALDDEQVLELATKDGSILVTHNVVDVPRILSEWLRAGRSHSGVILVHGIEHSKFELVAGAVERSLRRRPNQEDWIDVSAIVERELITEPAERGLL